MRALINRDGDPAFVFVAKDLVEAVGAEWKGSSNLGHIPEKYRGVLSVRTPSGAQEMLTLTEAGMNMYLFRSDKDGDPAFVFVAKDLVEAVGAHWSGNKSIEHIPAKFRGIVSVTTHSRGAQDTVCLTEAGMGMYLFRSDKVGDPAFVFVAKDLVEAVGATWSGHALDHIPAEYQRMVSVTTPSRGAQDTVCLTEAGMNMYLFRSDKDGDPAFAFVAKDLVEAVGATWNGTQNISHIPAEYQRVISVMTPGGLQNMVVLTEAGMGMYLFRSDKDGDPAFAFVAKDLVEAVGAQWITGSNGSVSHIPREYKGHGLIMTPGGPQNMVVLTEAGMNMYLFRSDKPAQREVQS